MFNLSSSRPCETRRAHWIPCENPEGKSRDLPGMFLFYYNFRIGQKIFCISAYIRNILYKHHSHN